MEKVLMSIKEVCEYTGWGMTKTREILKRSDSDFTIRVGNRLYVRKTKQIFNRIIADFEKMSII